VALRAANGIGIGSLAALLLAAAAVLTGCAGTSTGVFSEEPGARVQVTMLSGESFPATLVSLEDGALIVERSRLRGEDLSVVDRDGRQVVYVDGSPVGTAVLIRDVDVLVRERLEFFMVKDVSVVSRAYFGWGTAVAAVLAFFLVHLLKEEL
jgi:hypothetical protein